MSDLFEKLLIIRSPGIGPVKYGALIQRFGNASAAAEHIAVSDSVRDAVCREMDAAAAMNIHYVCDDDAAYPASLRGVKNHPPVISVRGNIDVLRRDMVSIVGTRHATAAGMGLVGEIAGAFASHGVAVVSGMAIGTDSAAHRGALRVPGDMQTVAVLAGGADYIWPVENESLYWEIVARGAVISEMPVGFVPNATNFIQRNRWIAAMSPRLILGEADLNSGSMATARFALGYNHDVFAIPSHPSDPRSVGPNSMIARGDAKLCMGASDFFGTARSDDKKQKNSGAPDSENNILDKLGMIPVSESVLAEIVKKSISEIKRDLVILELQGLVRKMDGGYVRV